MPFSPAYRAEVSRKVLHLVSATTPIVYIFVGRELLLQMLTPFVVVAVVVELARHASPAFAAFFRRAFGFMVRAGEWDRITGATYVLVAAWLTVWLFPKPVAIAALLIQSISDSAASLVGITFGRKRFLGKSFAGSGAFFVTALAIMWIVMPRDKAVGLAAALFATVVEALPSLKIGRFELNDNLTIPLLTGLAIVLLQRA